MHQVEYDPTHASAATAAPYAPAQARNTPAISSQLMHLGPIPPSEARPDDAHGLPGAAEPAVAADGAADPKEPTSAFITDGSPLARVWQAAHVAEGTPKII